MKNMNFMKHMNFIVRIICIKSFKQSRVEYTMKHDSGIHLTLIIIPKINACLHAGLQFTFVVPLFSFYTF